MKKVKPNPNCYGDGFIRDKSGQIESPCHCKKELGRVDAVAGTLNLFDLPIKLRISMLEHGLSILSESGIKYQSHHWDCIFNSELEELRGLL